MANVVTKIDRIAQLLAQGVTASVAASITGVSPSYISQLKSDPDFAEHLAALKSELAEEATTEREELAHYSDTLLGTEHQILRTLTERLPYMQDGHVISALREVGARSDAIRKHQQNAGLLKSLGEGQGAARVVQLVLPSVAVGNIVYGPNNEIIQIGGRSMTPMPMKTLQQILDGADREVIEHENSNDIQTAL